MKRAGGADNRDSPKRSMNTHPTTMSPLRARQFKGVSPLSDYELLDIIGEDTHGYVQSKRKVPVDGSILTMSK